MVELEDKQVRLGQVSPTQTDIIQIGLKSNHEIRLTSVLGRPRRSNIRCSVFGYVRHMSMSKFLLF